MPLQQVNVKAYNRKGKIIKAYQRKQDKKNRALKAAIGVAGVLGISVASYLVLKKRYISNLDAAAKNLKPVDELGKAFGDNIKDMTFVIGGFTSDPKIKHGNPLGQAKYISAVLSNNMSSASRKVHKIVPLDHSFNTSNTKKAVVNIAERFALLNRPFFTGHNPEAVKLAEEIYNFSLKNPGKPVNILGYSAGGILSRDIDYILRKRGVDVKLATFANTDLKLVPKQKSLDFMGTSDFAKHLKRENAVMIDGAIHTPVSYIENPQVKKDVFNYFYKESPYVKN